MFAALNVIVNTPVLLTPLLAGLERRIKDSPFDRNSKERRKFMELNKLSISRGNAMLLDAASHSDDVRAILNIALKTGKGPLTTWIRDTVLYGNLKAAAISGQHGKSSKELDAILSMASHQSFRRPNMRTPTAGPRVVEAYNEWARAGSPELVLIGIMRDVINAALVEENASSLFPRMVLRMPGKSVELRRTSGTAIPKRVGDDTGFIGADVKDNTGAGPHVVAYVRQGADVMILDSNFPTPLSVEDWKAGYDSVNITSTCAIIPFATSPPRPQGRAQYGGADVEGDLLTAAVVAEAIPLSAEAASALPADVASEYEAAVEVLEGLLDERTAQHGAGRARGLLLGHAALALVTICMAFAPA